LKVIRFSIQNRAVGLLVAILVLGLGIAFLTVGLALLAGLAITGALVGAGAAVYRALRGKSHMQAGQRLSEHSGLDPSLEVRATRPPTIASPRTDDK
jgi:hypothetical protein